MVAAVAVIHAGAVAAAQQFWFAEIGVPDAGVGDRKRFGQGGIGDPLNQICRGGGGVAAGAHEALRFGENMVALPARPVMGDDREHRFGGVAHPGLVDRRQLLGAGRIDLAQHRCQAAVTEKLDGLGAPFGAVLGQRHGLVFGFAGIEGGLLGQGYQFERGRLAPVVVLKFFGQLGGAGFDRGPACGPHFQQISGNADDLAHRALAPAGGLGFGEHPPQILGGVVLQSGVVQLRERDHHVVQRLAVEGQPAPYSVDIDGGDFRADHQVRV